MKACHGFSLAQAVEEKPPRACAAIWIDNHSRHRKRINNAQLKCVEAYENTKQFIGWEGSSTAQWSWIPQQIRLQSGGQRRAERVRIVARSATNIGVEN